MKICQVKEAIHKRLHCMSENRQIQRQNIDWQALRREKSQGVSTTLLLSLLHENVLNLHNSDGCTNNILNKFYTLEGRLSMSEYYFSKLIF